MIENKENKKRKKSIELGDQFERWTVIGPKVIDDKGKVRRLCRCACGTERLILERSLLYSTSKSCGCFRREHLSKVNSKDLQGKTFVDLTVLHRAQIPSEKQGIYWTCLCSCGQTVDILSTALTSGRKTNCGGPSHEKNTVAVDVTGQTFGELTALRSTGMRDPKGSVIWVCKCSCGNEIELSYNNLLYSNQRSCGCLSKKHRENIGNYLTFVDGTSINILKSKKIPTDNTTGYKGVYFIRGKYTAKIVFQKKAFYLGTYETAEEAAAVRKEAEELLFDGVTQFYERWNAIAAKDPAWAKANPVEIHVAKDSDGRLQVKFNPAI